MFAISALNYLDRFVMSGAAKQIAGELHLNPLELGTLASAFLVVYTLAALPVGLWADYVKRKNAVALCVGIWSVATAATALAGNYWTLFVSRMVLGIGEAGYFPAGTALMSDYFKRSVRSRIMSWWGTAQLFGILGGYVIGGVVAGLGTGMWRWAFVFTGAPGLFLAYLVWRAREPRRNEADEEEAQQLSEGVFEEGSRFIHISNESPSDRVEVWPSIKAGMAQIFHQIADLLRIKSLRVLIALQAFAFFVLGVNTVFLPTYLQQKDIFNFEPGTAGLYSGAIIVIAGAIGTVFGGYLADWLNRRHAGSRILVCGIGFLLSVPTFIVSMLIHDRIIFTIFFVLTVLLVTIYSGPSTAATQDVAPSVLRSSAVGVSLLLAHLLGDAFAPTLVGWIATVLDPSGGKHLAEGTAGQELSIALLVTCAPALLIAGLIGIFGARWMAGDVEAAMAADRQLKGIGQASEGQIVV
jgi:MFS family permease